MSERVSDRYAHAVGTLEGAVKMALIDLGFGHVDDARLTLVAALKLVNERLTQRTEHGCWCDDVTLTDAGEPCDFCLAGIPDRTDERDGL